MQNSQEIQGSTDLGIISKVKRGNGKRSNDRSSSDPLTDDSKDQSGSGLILAKLDEANRESCFGTGDDMKKKDKFKKVNNDLGLLEKTSDDIKVNHASNCVAAGLSKDNNYENVEHRMEDDTEHKSCGHNRSEKLKSSSNFSDEVMFCSENRVIDEGFKGSKKYKNLQMREKKKRKQKGIIDFNSLKNASAEGETNLEDEIIHGGPMESEMNQERQRKRKRNYKVNENSTCIDNCSWDDDKQQDKKRKRKDVFLVHVQDQGNSKKMAKDPLEKASKVISGGDAEEVPSQTHINNKDKKRGKGKKDIATGKEKGDQSSTAATTNYNGKSKSDANTLNIGKVSCTNESYDCELKKDSKKGKKKVSFSKEVEEFPLDQVSHEKLGPDNFVWGKRFTPEEDELIRKATMNYIEVNQLGAQGLHMILHCKSYWREVKDCWKVISAALPWRPPSNIFFRAHILFERSEERKWEPEELELLKRYYAEHGPKWRKLADILGKSRVHVKDAWRRIKLPNLKKGRWSQVEYQALFDLVNLDLRMKAFEEKKANHCVLKDNISWEAISNKMSTRGSHTCCAKWYYHLASSMVKEGNWSNLDDYKLIEALQKTDACCFDDVDWDNLLAHRSGEICRKRWHEMIRHLDKFWAMPFVDQVDLLSERYCADMIKYREMDQNKNHVSTEAGIQ